jgi:adenylate cyclase
MIGEQHGHVYILIGEGILAFLGGHGAQSLAGIDAVEAAIAMREALSGYNEELACEGLSALSIGIGLHRGSGVAGVVGTSGKHEKNCRGREKNSASGSGADCCKGSIHPLRSRCAEIGTECRG